MKLQVLTLCVAQLATCLISMREVLLLLVATAATAEQSCPCLTSLADYGISSSPSLSILTTRGEHQYPSSYGLASCAAHDNGLAPYCNTSVPPAWCYQSWCYVNASTCNLATSTTSYLNNYSRGDEVAFSYEACGAEDGFSAWFAGFAGTLKFCSVFAAKSGDIPCGNTATHLQVEAMTKAINNLTGGLGFQVIANNPSMPSYYNLQYEYRTYPAGQWETVGRGLSEGLFPLCDVIVGQGHGCSDAEIRAQARVAHGHKKLYFTLRGPRAVLAADDTLLTRLSPYLFSTHIRSDNYAHVALRQIALRSRALRIAEGKVGAGSSTAGSASPPPPKLAKTSPPVSIAVINFAHNAFFDGVGKEALTYAAQPSNGYRVAFNASLAGLSAADWPMESCRSSHTVLALAIAFVPFSHCGVHCTVCDTGEPHRCRPCRAPRCVACVLAR